MGCHEVFYDPVAIEEMTFKEFVRLAVLLGKTPAGLLTELAQQSET